MVLPDVIRERLTTVSSEVRTREELEVTSTAWNLQQRKIVMRHSAGYDIDPQT
jgi:hypothetical protein